MLGTLAVKPLWRAGASTRDRLGAVTTPTCGLGAVYYTGLVDLTIFRNLYSLIFLSRNPCHCFVFVCVLVLPVDIIDQPLNL